MAIAVWADETDISKVISSLASALTNGHRDQVESAAVESPALPALEAPAIPASAPRQIPARAPLNRIKARAPVLEESAGGEDDDEADGPIDETKRDIEFIRAVLECDGRPKAIAEKLKISKANYRGGKLVDSGLLATEGVRRGMHYALTPLGLALIEKEDKANGVIATAGRWTVEQRELMQFLKHRGGNATIEHVRRMLGWSETLVNRAAGRKEFEISDGVISLRQ